MTFMIHPMLWMPSITSSIDDDLNQDRGYCSLFRKLQALPCTECSLSAKDMILLLFDVSKLDISDEFRRACASIEYVARSIRRKRDLIRIGGGESFRPPEATIIRSASC